MEILSNFSSAYCFISFIIGAMFMFVAFCIAAMGKVQEPMNNVHFYVARDKDGTLALWLGKPNRGKYYWITKKGNNMFIAAYIELNLYGLNIEDYKDLKWEDKPVEVFLNLED